MDESDTTTPIQVSAAPPQPAGAEPASAQPVSDQPLPAQPTMSLLAPEGEAIIASAGPPPAEEIVRIYQSDEG